MSTGVLVQEGVPICRIALGAPNLLCENFGDPLKKEPFTSWSIIFPAKSTPPKLGITRCQAEAEEAARKLIEKPGPEDLGADERKTAPVRRKMAPTSMGAGGEGGGGRSPTKPLLSS